MPWLYGKNIKTDTVTILMPDDWRLKTSFKNTAAKDRFIDCLLNALYPHPKVRYIVDEIVQKGDNFQVKLHHSTVGEVNVSFNIVPPPKPKKIDLPVDPKEFIKLIELGCTAILKKILRVPFLFNLTPQTNDFISQHVNAFLHIIAENPETLTCLEQIKKSAQALLKKLTEQGTLPHSETRVHFKETLLAMLTPSYTESTWKRLRRGFIDLYSVIIIPTFTPKEANSVENKPLSTLRR